MIQHDFLHELQRFHLIMSKRVTSQYSGERKSIFSGSGTLFKEHRIYAPGDNYKQIDWKVYARTDDLYIKEAEAEKNLHVHILVDASKSMDYKEKFEYASKLGLGAAFLGFRSNEVVQFSTFADQVTVFREHKGTRQIMQMVEHLNKKKPEGTTNLFTCLQQYKRFLTSRTYLFIISDFLMPIEEIEEALQLLHTSHEVKLIQVLHEDEVALPLEGDFKLVDAESDNILKTYVSQRTREQYKDRLAQHTASLRSIAHMLNMDFYQCSTESSVFDTFFNVLAR